MTLKLPTKIGRFVRCSACKIYKPETEFHKNKSKKTGIQSQCDLCCSKMKKELSKNNRAVAVTDVKPLKYYSRPWSEFVNG